MTNNNVSPVQDSTASLEAEESPRLQKYLARCGVASRRACEKLIVEGHVTVNGEVVSELGTRVHPEVDAVCVDGVPVKLEKRVAVIMLNKPAGYVTTMNDPQGRPCVASLVPLEQFPGLFPVGRLDRDTSGLLLFTTDGELGNTLMHPRHHVDKTYLAMLAAEPTHEAIERLRTGIELSDGMTYPAEVERLEGEALKHAMKAFDFASQGASGKSNAAQKTQRSRKFRAGQNPVFRITIHEGRNRQVRRMFEAVGCPVIALHRACMGSLELQNLPFGSWRELTPEEIQLVRAPEN